MFFFFFSFLFVLSCPLEMCMMADYLGNDRTKNFDEILGPLPSNKMLFRNKHFILTCTIPIKIPIPAMASHSNGTNGFHIVRVLTVFLHTYSITYVLSYRLHSRQMATRTAMVMITMLILSARSRCASVQCLF